MKTSPQSTVQSPQKRSASLCRGQSTVEGRLLPIISVMVFFFFGILYSRGFAQEASASKPRQGVRNQSFEDLVERQDTLKQRLFEFTDEANLDLYEDPEEALAERRKIAQDFNEVSQEISRRQRERQEVSYRKYEALLEKGSDLERRLESLIAKMDAILGHWEEQQGRYDGLLNQWERGTQSASSRASTSKEEEWLRQPAVRSQNSSAEREVRRAPVQRVPIPPKTPPHRRNAVTDEEEIF